MAFTRSDLSKPAVPYVHQEFPKMVYHATENPRVVQNEREWAALGAAWGYVAPAPPEPVTSAHDDLADVPEPRRGRKARA